MSPLRIFATLGLAALGSASLFLASRKASTFQVLDLELTITAQDIEPQLHMPGYDFERVEMPADLLVSPTVPSLN